MGDVYDDDDDIEEEEEEEEGDDVGNDDDDKDCDEDEDDNAGATPAAPAAASNISLTCKPPRALRFPRWSWRLADSARGFLRALPSAPGRYSARLLM